MIYFILDKTANRVKIGTTVNLDQCLRQLKRGNSHELEVIKTLPGSYKEETDWHHKFKKYHYTREWYRLEGTLKDYLYPPIQNCDVNEFIESFRTDLPKDLQQASIPFIRVEKPESNDTEELGVCLAIAAGVLWGLLFVLLL